MTLATVARLAHVSVSTVSRALNNDYGISPETRQRVLDAAEACGYFQEKKRIHDENRRASFLVAVLCPEIESAFYSRIAALIAHKLKARGAECLIYNYDFDAPAREELLTRCLNDISIDAVVCFSGLETPFKPPDKPVISFGGAACYGHLVFDTAAILDQAVDYLLSCGCRRLAFAGEQLIKSKQDLFVASLARHALSPFACFDSVERFEAAGRAAARDILASAIRPDGVVCGYDEIAFGLIDELTQRGVNIPEDMHIVGINDVPAARYCFGGVSSVGYEPDGPLSQLTDDLLTFAKTGFYSPKKYIVPLHLAHRST